MTRPPFPHAHGPSITATIQSNNVNVHDRASILKRFLHGIGYYTPSISDTNKKLEDAMHAEMHERKIQCAQLERTLHMAASLAELAFYECTFEEKKNIALYNWFVIYVDDTGPKDVAPFYAFEQRFLRGLPQLDPVLTAFADVLLRLCDQYDAFSGNTILTTTFDFINSSCMESTVESLSLIREAQRFPWYLRDQTGFGRVYVTFMFTKTRKVAVPDYIQAMPDMNYWTSAANDLLSFHKEELAGESINYIHNRAFVEGIVPMQVLDDLGRELLEMRASIYAILARCPRAAETWQMFERGFIAWHLAQDRYKLKELGL